MIKNISSKINFIGEVAYELNGAIPFILYLLLCMLVSLVRRVLKLPRVRDSSYMMDSIRESLKNVSQPSRDIYEVSVFFNRLCVNIVVITLIKNGFYL